MIRFLKNLFHANEPTGSTFIPELGDEVSTDEEEAAWAAWHSLKLDGLERVLGPAHDQVGHAIIPFAIGGALDMHYFPHAVDKGTALASAELINEDGNGPMPSFIGTYELVAFTRHPVDTAPGSPFVAIERRLCGILTSIAHHARSVELSPGNLSQIPGDEDEPGYALVFDEWRRPSVPFTIDGRRHGLLLVIEIHRRELAFAMEHDSGELVDRLKAAGHFPYSDLDRRPIV